MFTRDEILQNLYSELDNHFALGYLADEMNALILNDDYEYFKKSFRDWASTFYDEDYEEYFYVQNQKPNKYFNIVQNVCLYMVLQEFNMNPEFVNNLEKPEIIITFLNMMIDE